MVNLLHSRTILHTGCVQIRVFDRDIFKADDDLGYALVPLEGLDLDGYGSQELDVRLRGTVGYTSTQPVVQCRMGTRGAADRAAGKVGPGWQGEAGRQASAQGVICFGLCGNHIL